MYKYIYIHIYVCSGVLLQSDTGCRTCHDSLRPKKEHRSYGRCNPLLKSNRLLVRKQTTVGRNTGRTPWNKLTTLQQIIVATISVATSTPMSRRQCSRESPSITSGELYHAAILRICHLVILIVTRAPSDRAMKKRGVINAFSCYPATSLAELLLSPRGTDK